MRNGIPQQFTPKPVKDCSKKVIYWKKRLAIAAGSRLITLCKAGKMASLASRRHEPSHETPKNDANDANDAKNHVLHSTK